VALEGGGALGLAHIGVLQWLEEEHVPVDYVARTSMGGRNRPERAPPRATAIRRYAPGRVRRRLRAPHQSLAAASAVFEAFPVGRTVPAQQQQWEGQSGQAGKKTRRIGSSEKARTG